MTTAAYLHADGYLYAGPEPVTIDPPVVPNVLDELARALVDGLGWCPEGGPEALVAALEARHWKLHYEMPPTPLVVHPPALDDDGEPTEPPFLVCPFCATVDGLRFQDSYCYERTVCKNEGDGQGGGILLVSGWESTDDPGDDFPGLCCINCAIDVPLAVPEPWEFDFR